MKNKSPRTPTLNPLQMHWLVCCHFPPPELKPANDINILTPTGFKTLIFGYMNSYLWYEKKNILC